MSEIKEAPAEATIESANVPLADYDHVRDELADMKSRLATESDRNLDVLGQLAAVRTQVASVREYAKGLTDAMERHVAYMCGLATAGNDEAKDELGRVRSIFESVYWIVDAIDTIADGRDPS